MLNDAKRFVLLMIMVASMQLYGILGATVLAAEPEQLTQLKQLNALAEKLINDIEAGHLNGAREAVLTLNEDVLGIQFKGLVRTEGVEALLAALITLQQDLTALSVSEHHIRISALKVRLAIDALTHPHQPMWLQYYKVLKDEGQHLTRAIAAQDQDQINDVLQRIMTHYEIIRPALLINREPSEVNKMDSYLKYLLSSPQSGAHEQYDVLLNELFQRTTPTAHVEYVVQPYNSTLWTSIIGGIIVAVLGYVAWRKYEAV